jgi:hypothetical protein
MIIWLNGPFGSGKTTVTDRLLQRLPALAPFDPEEVGFMLRDLLPGHADDFQDLPPWRPLVAATATELHRYHGRHLITPMTLLRRDYATEIHTAIEASGIPVAHLILHAATPVLTARIQQHDLYPGDPVKTAKVRAFRLEKLPAYESAYHKWLSNDAHVIDTTMLSPDEVVDHILEYLPLPCSASVRTMSTNKADGVPSAVGADLPRSEARSRGEVHAVSAEELADDDLAPERLATATDVLQLEMLRAIYHELRHGNDQAARQTAAIAEQTKVMADLAAQLEKVAQHLGDR